MQRDLLLDISIVDGPLPIGVLLTSAVAAAYLLVRRPTRKNVFHVMAFALMGAFAAFALKYVLVDILNTFGMPLTSTVTAIFVAFGATIGLAVYNLRHSRLTRKLLAGASAVVFAVAATISINASFGLSPTVAALLHINTDPAISLVGTSATPKPTS
ncbi:MAG: esterase [Subtercola sp.]|nr:esterase [Subtercola sp.]